MRYNDVSTTSTVFSSIIITFVLAFLPLALSSVVVVDDVLCAFLVNEFWLADS